MSTKPKTVIPYAFWASNQSKKNTTSYDNVIARQTSMEEAVFIRRFLWHWESHKKEGKGWVFVVPRSFAAPVGMSVYAFRQIIKRWEKLKLLESKSRGLPLKKYYRLDEDQLASYLSGLYSAETSISNLIETDKIGYRNREDKVIETDKISNPYKMLKRECSCPGDKPQDQRRAKSVLVLGGDKARKSPARRLSIRLFKAIHVHVEKNYPRNQLPKKDSAGRRNWTQWDQAFQALLESRKHNEQQIAQTIDWYGSHLNKRYVPKLYSAQTFCLDYVRVLEAIQREKHEEEKLQRQRRRDGTDTTQYPIIEQGKDGWTYRTQIDGSRGRYRTLKNGQTVSQTLPPAWNDNEEDDDDDFDSEAGDPYFLS